jgi:membrane-anchored protein YejM (alkaline phosphatase superfamily)
VLLALRYLPVVNLPEGAAARAFTVAMFLSQGVAMAGLGALLVLPLVLVVPRRRWVIAASFALALTGLSLMVVDGYVWQQYRLHLDASIWNLVTGGAFGETFVFATRTWLKLGFVVLVLGSLLAGCAWLATRLVRRRGRLAGVVLAISLGTIFVVHNGIYAWASAAGYTPITSQARILPAYRPLTAKRWFREHGLMPQSLPPIKLATGMGLDYPRAALSCTAPSSRPNVLFVVIDSWRADALKPEVTPNLAQAGRGIAALHESRLGRQRDPHRDVLALLRVAGHVLARHARRAARRGVRPGTDEAGLRRGGVPECAAFQPGIRSHDFRGGAWASASIGWRTRLAEGPRPDRGLRRLARQARLEAALLCVAFL